ncbi:N-acetyltransferase family protein [Sphingomonas gei]|uniref:N-acetyltransferase family protein n=1 Tax=Sphingomonas gei TaxID=1395960 RepID=A0A4S1XEP5_9SPHN|nr:GNAT family N-acetyltransferase [Sphingomonas gei]TGX54385.1 N-acetyltransferase family protein [Sphingomonas gei]
MTVAIRPVALEDAAAIAGIYAHHVLHGTATYETVPPSVAATREKIEHITAKDWPFLVACEGEALVGYCYATQFRDRPAYAYSCEDSIYVSVDHARRGIGRALLAALLTAATDQGFRQMVAVIGGAEPASIALHSAFGFEHAGRLPAMGWKAGRWRDSVYMQTALGAGSSTSPAAH